MISCKQQLLKLMKNQTGAVMLYALILLGVGSLLVPPLLSYTESSIEVGDVYETRVKEIYAADSGIEDATWYIKNEKLEDKFDGYSQYNYTNQYPYTLSDVNGFDVNVSVQNVWIPKIDTPDQATAIDNINGLVTVTGKIIQVSSGTVTYKVTMSHPEGETPTSWKVDTIGAWLPPGSSYIPGSSNLESLTEVKDVQNSVTALMKAFDPDVTNLSTDNRIFGYAESSIKATSDMTKLIRTAGGAPALTDFSIPPTTSAKYWVKSDGTVVNTEPHAGGHAVIWKFTTAIDFAELAPLDRDNRAEIIFQYAIDDISKDIGTIGWLETTDFNEFFWDADNRIYEITSTAGRATAQAHTNKSKLRELAQTIQGDYVAVGNGLLGGCERRHDELHEYSSIMVGTNTGANREIDELPDDAVIEQAWLYWAGWIDFNDYDTLPSGTDPWKEKILVDNCSNFVDDDDSYDPLDTAWNHSGDWAINSDRFQVDEAGILMMASSLDLSHYQDQRAMICMDIDRSEMSDYKDKLWIRYSGDGGINWSEEVLIFNGIMETGTHYTSIPADYLTDQFTMRLRFEDTSSGDILCFIDEITIGILLDDRYPSLRYPYDIALGEVPKNLVEKAARVNSIMLYPDSSFTNSGTKVTAYVDNGDIRTFGWLDSQNYYTYTWDYACRTDVTDLVNQWIDDGKLASNGAGDYSVGHVYTGDDKSNVEKPGYSVDFVLGGSTGYPLGSPAHDGSCSSGYPMRYEAAVAGWSLVLIYSSPQTQGHQLYLYDDMFELSWHNDVDFDGDSEPGGTITGFLVPPPDPHDPDNTTAKMTAFVIEGDAPYGGDEFIVNKSNRLNSDNSAWDNVWDGDPGARSVEGVDIDTFTVHDKIVESGDTEAQINLPTDNDGFFLTYLILSFRSEITSGGAMDYVLEF